MTLESTVQISPAESPLPLHSRNESGDVWGEDGTYDGPALSSLLPVERFNPPHGLCVAHFSQVPLRGRKIRMPENHF